MASDRLADTVHGHSERGVLHSSNTWSCACLQWRQACPPSAAAAVASWGISRMSSQRQISSRRCTAHTHTSSAPGVSSSNGQRHLFPFSNHRSHATNKTQTFSQWPSPTRPSSPSPCWPSPSPSLPSLRVRCGVVLATRVQGRCGVAWPALLRALSTLKLVQLVHGPRPTGWAVAAHTAVCAQPRRAMGWTQE